MTRFPRFLANDSTTDRIDFSSDAPSFLFSIFSNLLNSHLYFSALVTLH